MLGRIIGLISCLMCAIVYVLCVSVICRTYGCNGNGIFDYFGNYIVVDCIGSLVK